MKTLFTDAVARCLPLTLLCGLCAASEARPEAPAKFPLEIEHRVGLVAHLTEPPAMKESEWNLLESTGVRVIRVDFKWWRIEKIPGKYDWAFYDDLIQKLQKRRIRPLLIIGYPGNTLTPTGTKTVKDKVVTYHLPPNTDEEIAALARMAGAAAERYRSYNPIWEIWNEPDNNTFWPPQNNAYAYTRMAVEVARVIRQKVPDAALIAPAMSGVPSWHFRPEFLPVILKSDLGRLIDAVSIHPYRKRNPETVLKDMPMLEAIVRDAQPQRASSLPYLFSEWGYSTAKHIDTDELQAAYLVRCQMAGLMAGACLTVWYDWRDDGSDPKEGEHHFGIIRANGEPKPAFYAFRQLLLELKGYRFEKRIPLNTDSNYALLFSNSQDERKLVVWTADASADCKLPSQYRALGDARDISGNPVALKMERDQYIVPLSPSPAYITIK